MHSCASTERTFIFKTEHSFLFSVMRKAWNLITNEAKIIIFFILVLFFSILFHYNIHIFLFRWFKVHSRVDSFFSRKLHSRQHARANFQQVKPKTYSIIDENKLLESSAPWCCKLKQKSTLSLPLNNENISLQVVFSFSPTKIPAELTMLIAIHEAEKKRRWDQCERIN